MIGSCRNRDADQEQGGSRLCALESHGTAALLTQHGGGAEMRSSGGPSPCQPLSVSLALLLLGLV